jgi:hypothetical protein
MDVIRHPHPRGEMMALPKEEQRDEARALIILENWERP